MLSKLPRFTEWLRVRVVMVSCLLAGALSGAVPAVNAASDPNQGPGGPILVVTNGTTNFGRFYAEILRTEGLNSFAVADIGAVNATLLSSYDVVLLAKTSLTGSQVTALTNWVNAGGNLIAMDPDAQLYSLAGISAAGTTLSNAYLRVDTTNAVGSGIVGQTIQFHGIASRVTLSSASALATLYSNSTTGTVNPAVTLNGVGSNGGQVAVFTYDLATSIVYTRQGNPAWSGQERDGTAPIRPDDLFYGDSASDPQPDWIDLSKVAIPQADEQQRLLANLITQMNLDRKPLPRFWYFPNGHKAVVIMTGDDHGQFYTGGGATVSRFDQFLSASTPGCSVANWECIRGTSYLFASTTMSNAEAAAFEAQGFEVGLHINTLVGTNCVDYTQATLENYYQQQLADFAATFPSIPSPITQRHHCIVWSDWASGAKVQLNHGMRLDTSYYYWPPNWVQNNPGHFTGSAMPMRFADLDGSLIDVFQAVTQMTDESGQVYPFTPNALLDRAVGTEENYGAYTVNAHIDVATEPESDTVVAAAQARGVPVVSAKQMLAWLDARNSSSFGSLSWGSNSLSFTVAQGAGATGLTALVPRRSGGALTLSTITRNGTDVPYEVTFVKGVEYASIPAAAGNYVAAYAPDTIAPTIAARSPASGAAGVGVGTPINITFSEAMDPASISASSIELRTSANAVVPAMVTYNAAAFVATVTPSAALANSSTYSVVVRGGTLDPRVKDTSGNSLAATSTWSFTTSGDLCPCTIWPNTATPVVPADSDTGAVELGVKFRSDAAGYITALRFYKGSGNSGTHTGHLWTSTGLLLATATFTSETTTGWQQVALSSPVAIAANTVYVASYHAPNGRYAADGSYFASAGVDNGVLHALSDVVGAGNGVYGYGASGTFPSGTFGASNYWVDVVFSTTPPADTVSPTIAITSPTTTGTFATSAAAVTLIGSATDNISVTQVTWTNDRGGSGTASGTSAWTVSGIALQTGANVLAVTARDAVGNTSSATLTVTYTPAASDTTPPTIASRTPLSGAVGVAVGTAVTITFNEEMDAATINASTLELRTAANALVPSAVSYSGVVATLTPNASLANSATYTVTVKGGATDPRVKDVAGNALAANAVWSFTTASAVAAPVSIWSSAAVPGTASEADTAAVELGVKFRSDVDGTVTGIRFYKGPANAGIHVGNLWSSGGSLLASATFTGESASGWQQVTFTTPVAISAGTTYVASYFAPNGGYAADSGFFASAGIDNGNLHALSNAAAAGNGVYTYASTSAFPSSSFASTNYWVDVLFVAGSTGPDTTPPTISGRVPAPGATNVATNSAVTVTFNESMDATTISGSTFELRNAANALVAATVSYSGTTATLVPSAVLANLTTYTVTVRGGGTDPRVKDVAGNALVANDVFSFTTAAAGGPCSANVITAENCLAGNPASEWDVSGAGDASIQGFATQISVNRGSTVSFKVDTNAANYRFDIYRMGYYGGQGARKIATVNPSASLPQNQPNCLTQAASGLIDCGNWAVSGSWAVPANATSGIYFAKVVRTDTGGASHIVFIVRDDASTSDMVFQTSDTTWHAYNNYGGNSLYTGGPGTNPGRAYKVSYNRPFATRAVDGGQDWVFNSEYPMVRFLEANGYNVSYISGVDTDRAGSLLLNHRMYLSVGHDEYWSGQQRANVEAARAAGVHLAFFSGNEVFWKTRWEPSIDGSGTAYRTLVSYKETHAGAKIDPSAEWTGTWRDPRFSPPADGGRPENALTGTAFTVNSGTSAIVVPAAEGKMRFWRNTSIASLAANQSATLPQGTLGYEWDSDLENGFRPAGLVRMSNTTVSGVDKLQDYGSSYATDTANHALTFYRHGSGARVFGAGTIQWSWGLDATHDRAGTPADARMQQATINLFADMNVQPATLQTGLVTAFASTDAAAPTTVITAPLASATLPLNTVTTISGTAADTGGVVGGVEVSVDGGTTWRAATGRETWTYTWTPTVAGPATIRVRAVDDSGNLSAGTSVAVTVGGSASCPCSIWTAAQSPVSGPDLEAGASLELGTRFRASANGFITAIRFYKNSGNTGTHTGTLWNASGGQLAQVTFAGESASGWQQMQLASPVAITANTWYVVSYHTSSGSYIGEDGYFASSGVTNGPLYAARDGDGGSNGLYAYSAGTTFPNQTYNSENYWVDVVYTNSVAPDTAAPVVTITSPTSSTTFATATASLTLGGTASDNVAVTQVTWASDRGGGGTATGTTAWSVSAIVLQTGSNTLTVTARDAAGNTSSDVLTVTYTPDITAPVVAITAPTSQATYVASAASLNLAGSASDAVGVTQVTWVNDRGGSGTASGTTTWSVTGITLLSGSNVLTVTARDAAGNSSTDVLTVTYAGDTTAPVVTITSPVSTTTYSTSASTLNIGGTASDAVGVTQVTWANDRGGSGTAAGTTSWTVSNIALQAGANVLTVTARDAVGNASTDVLTVTRTGDTTAPVVTITTPTSATTLSTTATSLTLGGTASDAIGVTQVTWLNSAGGSGTATGTTSWSVAGVALVVGSNVLTVTARDAAGNTSTDVLTVTRTADTTAPVVTITTPTSATTLSTSATSLTLGGTASDAIGVTQVTWVNSAGGSGTATGTTSWSVTGLALQLGANVLTVTARDAAGNTSTDILTVTRTAPDTTQPIVTITSPTSATTFATTGSSMALGGTASDNVGVTQVTWSNSRGGSGTATGTTSWSVGSIALSTGSNVITVTARDAAGNTRTDVITVTRDSTLPSVTITGPTSNSTLTTTATSVVLSGTASDNIAVTQVTWTSSRGGSGTATGTTTWSAGAVALLTGSNVLTVTARDAAGNTRTDTLTVTRN